MHTFLKRMLCLALLAIGTHGTYSAQAPVPAQTAPPEQAAAKPAGLNAAALQVKVDELLDAHVKVNHFSGTVLLAEAGTPLVARGYGYANAEWQIPNAADTKFRIGSITKQFTSMLVMQLRERGRLKLEDSVCAYVTPCPDTWKPVTIHHLLTHTSGIPTYTGIAEWRKVNMMPKTIDEMIGFFRDLPLQWPPGEKFAYNNSGYFLLGVVAEKAAGKKYEEALQEMILGPLGMKDTGYDWPGTILPRRASGYNGGGPSLQNARALDMQQPYAAGALYSTVEDLLKWDQALYTDTLLPEAARTIMWTPVLSNYAYGWSVMPAGPATFGHRRIAHTGGINGFSSVIIRVPDSKVTAIVLSNNETVNAGAVGRDVLALYYGQPYTVPAPRTIAKVDPAVFDQYAGQYQLGPGFIITITRDASRLMAQATGQGAFEVFPESDARFFAKVAAISITFVKGSDGKVTHLVLTQGGRDQEAKKIG